MRRTAAGVLAGALALSGAVATALPANAGPGFALERVAGADRYETSAAIAAQFGVTSGAILASGETGRSVDALSANFLAGVQGVPVLLTRRNSIPASVLARLNALTGAKNVTIVGGTVAVSAAVETQLRTAGFTVTRLGGADRYATSEEIIKAGAASASTIGLVASGTSFPDALAGGPLAYKGKHPVFLTSGGGLPQDTIDAMVAAGTRSVIILGGTAAVPASVETALAARGIAVVTRLGGAGRSETSRIIADYLITSQGFTNTTFNVASGVPRGEGVDALSGAALSGKENRALLITDNVTSAAPVVAFAAARASTLNAVGDIFGGPAAVAIALEEAIEAAGRAAGNFQTLNVVPQEAVTLQLADESTTGTTEASRNADNRTYTVTGLTAGTRYRITLVNAASIQGTGTNRTFLSSAIGTSTTAFGVDLGADIADIVSVNGATPTNNGAALDAAARTATATPVAGNITFTIDGTNPGTVVPVVYVDGGQGGTATTGGADVRLETSATAAGQFAAVTETFGLGGPTTFINPAAASGTFGTFATPAAAAVGVQSVNKGANQFDANNTTFTYDANDVFRISGVPVSLEEFEARLSSGDLFSASYSATASVTSTFDLTDDNPDTPAAPVAAVVPGAANSNDITVTVTVTGDVDQVQIQRATVTGSPATAGTFTTVATEPATDDNTTAAGVQVVFVDNNLAAGTYRYRAVFVNDGDTGAVSPDSNDVTATTPPAPDTTAPTTVATTLTTDAGFSGVLDSGDVFTVRASEALANPVTNNALRVQDADGTIVDIVCGTNATCALNTAANPATPAGPNAGAVAGSVLTVTLTGAPTTVAAGTTVGLQFTGTIISTAGITDVAGNRLSLTGDTTINS